VGIFRNIPRSLVGTSDLPLWLGTHPFRLIRRISLYCCWLFLPGFALFAAPPPAARGGGRLVPSYEPVARWPLQCHTSTRPRQGPEGGLDRLACNGSYPCCKPSNKGTREQARALRVRSIGQAETKFLLPPGHRPASPPLHLYMAGGGLTLEGDSGGERRTRILSLRFPPCWGGASPHLSAWEKLCGGEWIAMHANPVHGQLKPRSKTRPR